MKNLICILFGHRPAFGWCHQDGEGYFRVTSIAVDGIGRHHLRLCSECERCGDRFKVGNVHLPAQYVERTRSEYPAQVKADWEDSK